jgi:hypothetical protein
VKPQIVMPKIVVHPMTLLPGKPIDRHDANVGLAKWAGLYLRLRLIYLSIKHDPCNTE